MSVLYWTEGCLWTSEVYVRHLWGEEVARIMELRIKDPVQVRYHQLVMSPSFP